MSLGTQPPSLRLVIDASSADLFCGLEAGGAWRSALRSPVSPLEGLADLIRECLDKAEATLPEVRGFVVCEGPGNILGLRLAVMMVNAWRTLPPWRSARVLRYRSLAAAAAALNAQGQLPTPSWLVSPSRQGMWNRWQHPEGVLDLIPESELSNAEVPVVQLPARKRWLQPETAGPVVQPGFETDAGWLRTPGLLEPVDQLQVYHPGANTYRTWTPERHRRPCS